MFFQQVKSFLTIINTDALIFLGTRLASIILSIVSIVLLCRAVTVQTYFLTDGLGLIYDMLPFGAVGALPVSSAHVDHSLMFLQHSWHTP